MPAFFFVEETGRDRILRKSLQGERGDEFDRVLRHHDEDVVALLDEQARQLGRFVGGDRAGDAEDDRSFLLASSLGVCEIGQAMIRRLLR